MQFLIGLVALMAASLLEVSPLAAAPCTAQEFATAVDASGASLRALTLDAQPKLQERLRRYQRAMKLSDTEYENNALDSIQDATLDEFDKKSSALLLTVDSLGRVPPGSTPDCAKLAEVKSAAAELNTVIKAKSDYMLKRLDVKISEAEHKSALPSPPVIAPTQKRNTENAAKIGEPTSKPTTPPQPSPSKPASLSPKDEWAADTKRTLDQPEPRVAIKEPDVAPPPPQTNGDGYTIDEIRNATRGFFGTISTNLAAVIEHAFKQSGRPTAYVLGTEGGGAFLAGLRFGEGTLYMRSQPGMRKVYWHGPSLGTDFGASGSRTLFLIYGLQEPDALYRNFTGIDGSAYFVGGVGVTLLKGGPVIMAPIRSGVGMRLGANIGYLKFTERPTWNPF
jgi:hypothetical protein